MLAYGYRKYGRLNLASAELLISNFGIYVFGPYRIAANCSK